ncbi:hypothetical protein [Symbiopectobacterium sp.]|uniref:hypothetical protein n=1 Tax=Symbiopectobacterium sp. TaxID=2952789 RepID=UPI003F3289CF
MNGNRPGWLPLLITLLTLSFLLVPIAMIFPLAFSTNSYLSFPPQGFSLKWMRAILQDSQ